MNFTDGVSGVLQYRPDPGRTGLNIGGGVYGGISMPPLEELQLSMLGLIQNIKGLHIYLTLRKFM